MDRSQKETPSLLTYLQTFFIDFKELQYSTLIFALKCFVNKGQYVTIQVLSIDTSYPRKLMFELIPLSCEDLRRYSGYPSCPVCVSLKKWLGIALYKFHPSCMENVDVCFRMGREPSALLQCKKNTDLLVD
ncbi:hypothetical protein AVEN_43293-1 [Araneus ventricosus]|uniref:Uncharacterized protein n=1 Tax=Araneus ventricosus TaxID=182803 RepID=A0A4Y2GG19_ARAVE|nr:hypothetical protein AVEN_43293-1 [Araneus ventricosus]